MRETRATRVGMEFSDWPLYKSPATAMLKRPDVSASPPSVNFRRPVSLIRRLRRCGSSARWHELFGLAALLSPTLLAIDTIRGASPPIICRVIFN